MHVLYTERCVRRPLGRMLQKPTPSLKPHAMYVVWFQAVARNMHKQAEAASLLKQLSSLEAKVCFASWPRPTPTPSSLTQS